MTEGAAPPVQIDVLGPLRLTVGGDAVDVPGPKRRALLALLAVAAGRALPVDDLLDALWPGDQPEGARASLHSHVSRLRRHLGAAAARLEGMPDSYRLDLGDGGTDVDRARALLGASAEAGPDAARRLLGEARSLWRGAPLAEFPDVAPLAALAVSLDELRRTIDARCAQALLDAGLPHDATELAGALAAGDPLWEGAAVLTMRALAASGRHAEALRAGYDYRRRLAGTGLEPTPELARAERDIAGLAADRPGSVPRPADRLRGRESELAALHRLLADERLVTVLGPGGVGKTRLAVEFAARAHPVTTLLLSPVTDAAAIPHALAAALDLRVTHGDVLPACAALLAAGPHLLLVDNCEHLLDGIRDVVGRLLDRCPDLTVLATSREPLGLAAEQRLRIAPLAMTGTAESPAVALFVDRARRVRPDFTPGPGELDLIARIVRALDGMPLAIGLAAGRLSSLGLADLHARLDRALDLLGDGRDVTLRQTIEWSYRLLPPSERRLLRHLGVFPDGFDLGTAEAVASGLDLGADAAGALAHLVDASVVEGGHGEPPRYRMLDTVRSFTQDQLGREGEAEAATERFLAWALELAAWVDRTVATGEEARVDDVLRRELGNLRAAWGMLQARDRVDDAVRFVLALSDAAGWRDLTEVWGWAVELAGHPAIERHPGAAAVLGLAADASWARGQLDRAEQLARRGLELAGWGGWRCRAALALVSLSRGDLAGAVAHGTDAAMLAGRPEQSLGVAALAAAYRGDLDAAAALNDRQGSVAVSPTLRAFHAYVAGEISRLGGRDDDAEQRYRRAIALARTCGSTFVGGIAGVGLVSVQAAAGRVDDALAGYRELLDYWDRTGGWVQLWTTLRNLAALLQTLGDGATALFLLAAADAAPDAPPVAEPAAWKALAAAEATRIRADGATASRAQVLQVARAAIARHLPARTGGSLAGYQPVEPGSPLKGPTTLDVIQPP